MKHTHTSNRKMTPWLLTLSLLGSAACANAQSTNANLSGTVTDTTGAIIPNATVTVTDKNTGVVHTAVTASSGEYTLPQLQPDPYTVSFSASGFNVQTVQNVVIAAQVDRRVNGQLSVGATESIQVSDTTPLQQESAALQDSVSERQVRELPLLVGGETAGRSPLAFVFLDSSVTTTGGAGTNTANFRVAGNLGGSTDILIDGAPTRRAQNGDFFTEVAPGPNAYQELTLSTSQYSAEYGASGGVVNFITKAGGNRYHGEVYDLLQNDKLNANSTFNSFNGVGKPRDHQNDFGANIGGPIRIPHLYNGTDKAFFFFNYEGYRFNHGENVYTTVPTALMRTGDFSELLTDPYVISQVGGPVQIYDPHVTGVGRPAIPGNRLDQYTSPSGIPIIDPAGQNIINLYPMPTRAGVYHNYLASTVAPVTMNQYTARGDYNISGRQHFMFSYSYRKQPSVKGGFPRFTNSVATTANGVWDQLFLSHYIRSQYDFTFTPAVTNHLNLGFNRIFVTNHNPSVGSTLTASTFGIPANANQNIGAPRIGFPGYGSEDAAVATDPRVAQEIGSTFFDDKQGDDTVDIADIVSISRGKHFVRFGGDFRIEDFDVTQYIDPGGSYNFRADQTGLPNGNNGAVGGTGWTLASLLTGATEYSFVTIHTAQPAYRFKYPSVFASDDYKVTSKLVLNLGLRYELPLTRTEAHNYLRGFSPTTINPVTQTPGALIGANAANGPRSQYRSLAANYYASIAPRLGFAYTVNSRTVLRGGWGLFYGPLQYSGDITAGTLGYSVSRTTTPGNDYSQSAAFLSTYQPAPVADPTSQFIQPGCTAQGQTCQDVQEFNSPYRTGLVQQFNLNVQHDLGHNFTVQIAYIGHLGQRLNSNFQRPNALPYNDLLLGGPILNKLVSQLTAQDLAYATSLGINIPTAPYAGFAGSVAQALKPFPQYGFIINANENQGRDYYNAGQVNVNHNFANGLQAGVSYTFSKLTTNAAEDVLYNSTLGGVLQYPTPGNIRALHSLSPSDVPHTVVINYLYELPFGKNHMFFNGSRLANEVLGGFQISGIQRYSSGSPLVLQDSNNSLTSGLLNTTGAGGSLRPNLTGAPLLSHAPQTGVNYNVLNPAAFSQPAQFNVGGALAADSGSPAYAAYFADTSKFFGNAPAVLGNVRPFNYLAEDISVLKKTSIREGTSLELRAEGFNVFNRHSYGVPTIDLNNGTSFSQATVLGGGRTIQVGARLIY